MTRIITVLLAAAAVLSALAMPAAAAERRIEIRYTDATGHLRSGTVADVAALSAGCFPRSQADESGPGVDVLVLLGGGQSGKLVLHSEAKRAFFVAETDFLAPDSACEPSEEFRQAIRSGRLVSTSRAPVWVAIGVGLGLLLLIACVALGGLGVGPMPSIELSDSTH